MCNVLYMWKYPAPHVWETLHFPKLLWKWQTPPFEMLDSYSYIVSVKGLWWFQTHPIDHEEKDAIVCDGSHWNIKSRDNTKFAPPLNIIDERVARSIKQVACNTTLGKCQLVPEGRSRSVIWYLKYFETDCDTDNNPTVDMHQMRGLDY